MSEVEKYLKLYNEKPEKLIEMAHITTLENFSGNEIEFCSIISAKTGACPENCKYCSQSLSNQSEINIHPLLGIDEVFEDAKQSRQKGANCYGIVTSGRSLSAKDFENILEMVRKISKIEGLKCCGCFGMLDQDQMNALKEAGCERYNHNINTNESHYSKICSSHNYKDRIETIKRAKLAGMEICAGVILGMEETREDRIKMALELSEIEPESVPINILNPIKGTYFENMENEIDETEVLKTICIFRLILKKSILRYAGGRNKLSYDFQKLGLLSGINGILSGDYLTTTGQGQNEDIKMILEAGFSKKE